MADSTIANAPAEASATGGNDDDPVDVLWRNVQHLLCQAEKDWQTIKMYQRECDQLETIRKMTQYKLEAAWRRHHSDKDKIQELQGKLEVTGKLLKMKSQAEPPRPSLSAEAQGDKNFHLEVHDGKRATLHSEADKDRWRQYYQRHQKRILARRAEYYQRHKERILAEKAANCIKLAANRKMSRILKALQERGNGATLDQLGEVFMQRCKSSASRDALARLLAASDGSVGTSASASGSSEASSGSGGGVPSPAAAARRKGSTLQRLGDVPVDAEGEPQSKKMKQAGPTEGDNQK